MNLTSIFPNINERVYQEIIKSTQETLIMTGITAVVAGILGLALGVILVVTKEHGILQNKLINNFLDKLINTFRSIPFLILSVLIIPFTRFIAGTSLGLPGAIVPLVVIPSLTVPIVEVDVFLSSAAQAANNTVDANKAVNNFFIFFLLLILIIFSSKLGRIVQVQFHQFFS